MIALQSFVLTVMSAYDYNVVMKHKRSLKIRNVMFRMTEEEVERLDRIAVSQDRTRSQVLRRFVMDGMDRYDPPKLVANGDC